VTETEFMTEIRQRFSEHLRALGQVAHSWNYLQEQLGALFAIVLADTHNPVSLAIWYSEPNDRAQRRLLRAAINAGALDHIREPKRLPASAKDDLLWLLSEADKLGARRDQALHAPVALGFGPEGADFMAAFFQGNPLAEHLRNKNLMEEYEVSAMRAGVLSSFVSMIALAITSKNAPQPWPDKRPSLSRETLPRSKE
jgi:hypothetical protein